jgi:uncharacterized protein
MLYLDASLLVAALTNEAQTERMQFWLDNQAEDTLFVSDWVTTEFCAALSVKLRAGQITAENRTSALRIYSRIEFEVFGSLPISKEHFKRAAHFSNEFALALRAGDALHLAIAAAHGAELCTLDKRLASAGEVCGVTTRLI